MATLLERVFAQPSHQQPYVLEDDETPPPHNLFSFLGYHLYADLHEYPSQMHLVRAWGGPGANLLISILMLPVYLAGERRRFALFLTVVNLAFTLAALMPLPTMDGGAVLHELRNWRASST